MRIIYAIIIILSVVSVSLCLTNNKYACTDCNVIIISVTNLRTDHLHFNGYARETSPNIDKLSQESLVFDNYFSHSSWTLPAGTSLLTSLYPTTHGVMNRYSTEHLSRDVPTLADVLNQNGYNTVAFTGGFDYDARYNVVTRFSQAETILNNATGKDRMDFYGRLEQTVPLAINWIEKNSGKGKFFMFVQGFDTHCPFTPDSSYFGGKYNGSLDLSSCVFNFGEAGNETYHAYQFSENATKQVNLTKDDVDYMIAQYDSEIVDADRLVGQLLEKINDTGLSKKTIVVLTSEHGDLLGENGLFMRSGPVRGTFYDYVLHVPLIIKYPAFKHRNIDGLVQSVDVMPTLLDFLGIKTNIKMEGKSIVPLLDNRTVNDFVYAATKFFPYGNNPVFSNATFVASVRNNEWKFIKEITYSSQTEHVNFYLYNIKNDPGETNNLIESNRQLAFYLENILNEKFNLATDHVLLAVGNEKTGDNYSSIMLRIENNSVSPVNLQGDLGIGMHEARIFYQDGMKIAAGTYAAGTLAKFAILDLQNNTAIPVFWDYLDSYVRSVFIDDINGDGTKEIVVGTRPNGILKYYYFENGWKNVTLGRENGAIHDILVDDFDDDGKKEILLTVSVPDSNSFVPKIIEYKYDGQWKRRIVAEFDINSTIRNQSVLANPRYMFAGNFGGDKGVVTNIIGTGNLIKITSNGSIQYIEKDISLSNHAIDVGDLDGDGFDEIVTSTAVGNMLFLYKLQGDAWKRTILFETGKDDERINAVKINGRNIIYVTNPADEKTDGYTKFYLLEAGSSRKIYEINRSSFIWGIFDG